MSPQSRYTILRKIADGGTAEIFLGKQAGASGFEKLVVLKRIFNTFYSDPQFRHMLVDEAHIAMSLYHSNIVQVLDLGEDDGRHFLALELVDGWTLDGVLKRAKAANFPFPPALALYVTAEVCRALAYAHSKSLDGQPLGIVHRDVSPQNVLLSEHGEVKLTDFGIAKGRTKHEQSLGHVIKGKIGFMSPEQAHGHELDARSDLFSLGVVLYLMITRQPPFDAPTDYETLMQVRAGDFVPPETARPRLNREVYRVIRKAMANAPSDRYQNATEMLVDVEHVMRVGFRALGQTELARWLSDLSGRDGVPPLTRAQPPPIESVVSDHAPITTASTLATPPPSSVSTRSGVESSADSSVELDLTDAVLVSPLPFWNVATFRKRARWATGVVLLLALVVTALKIVRSHERVTSASSLRERRAMTSSATESSSVAAPASAAASVARTPTLPAPTTVSIQSDPDGIQVRRGQRMFGVTPMSIKLRPGSYRLTFTKPGYVPTNKTVLVPRSGRRSIHVSLRRARAHKPGRTEPMSAGSEDTVWHFSR